MLAGLRRGDDAAYEALVRQNAGRMLAVARRLLRNEEDAQDAVQDAFLSAFQSLDRFEGGSKVSTWLHRIAVNAALMRLRARKARPEEPIDALLPRFADSGHHVDIPAAWPISGEQLVQRHETVLRVRQAIDRLPENYRNVLLLRDIEGLSTDEAARALGVNSNSTKVRLHRARLALRTLLDREIREVVP